MKLITRHEIYGWFLRDHALEKSPLSQMVFNHTSDLELAETYHLTYLRPGYFY